MRRWTTHRTFVVALGVTGSLAIVSAPGCGSDDGGTAEEPAADSGVESGSGGSAGAAGSDAGGDAKEGGAGDASMDPDGADGAAGAAGAAGDSGTDASEAGDAGTCGDGVVDPGEDCDLGQDNGTGQGCEANCTWTCVPGALGDATCSDHQACNGKETCTSNHVCAPGTPAPDESSCGQNKVCLSGACVDIPDVCSDGLVHVPNEECDDGNKVDGDGCDSNCLFSCVSTDKTRDCTPADPCAGQGTCDDASHTCSPGTALPDWTVCGSGMVCKKGACVVDHCGDGTLDPDEECDFGSAANGPGTGCEKTCTFSCTKSPDSCPDANACNGIESCTTVTVSGHTGQKCAPGTNASDGTDCGGGNVCLGGVCKAASCGDGIVEANEDCEPPNTPTCDAQCHTQCDMTGKWALKVTLPVTWGGGLTQNGTGNVFQWSLIDRTVNGTTGSESGDVCKLVVPDFSDTVFNDTYALVFPSPLGFPAPFTTTATFGGFKAGSTYATPLTANVMGAVLASPITDAWPSNATLVSNAASKTKPYASDDDSDGKLGITVTAKSGGGYALPPLNVFATSRADKVYLAVRQVQSLSGKLDSCTQVSGSATVTKQDSAVVGCHVSGGSDCSTNQRDFLDGNRVVYKIGNGASFVMQKLAATATCADAIAAIP